MWQRRVAEGAGDSALAEGAAQPELDTEAEGLVCVTEKASLG